MSWQDRIRDLAWTSPTGRRFVFAFEDLEQSFEKKGEAVDFINADETLARDYGATGRQFPVRLYQTGPDCDLNAREFDNALHERGFGQLEYPLSGTYDVVVIGKVTRRDDLVTAGNQVVWELTFTETTDLLAPTRSQDVDQQISDYQTTYEDQLITEVQSDTRISGFVTEANLKAEYTKGLAESKQSMLQTLKTMEQKARKNIFGFYDSVTSSIDLLIQDPYTLAAQSLLTVKAVSEMPADAVRKVTGYVDLLQRIIGPLGAPTVLTPADGPGAVATFAQRRLFAGAAASGLITAARRGPWTTKTQALTAAITIQDQVRQFRAWVESNVESLAGLGSVNSYDDQDLNRAANLAAGSLVELSFGLLQERVLVTDRAWGLVPLCARLYGEIDDHLDQLITQNDLSGSEILEIPRGRSIVYYN